MKPFLPDALKETSKPKPAPPPRREGASLLLRLSMQDAGQFYSQLEGHGHLAYLTVLDMAKGLVRLVYVPGCEKELLGVLLALRKDVPFEVLPWPFAPASWICEAFADKARR